MSNEELVSLIQQGVNTADNMALLYDQTRHFIYQIANRYKGSSDIEDLEQEGYFGLCEAVKRYDPDQGVKFLSYASHWINQIMMRYIENHGNVVRIPSHNHSRMLQYDNLVKKFARDYNREPTDREICGYLEISKQQLKHLKRDRQMRSISSTDSLLATDGNELTLGDTIASTEDMEAYVIDKVAAEQLRSVVWSEVDRLPEQQGNALKYRYIGEMTLDAIGQVMGITRESVRQHERKALRSLRCKHDFIRLVKEYDIIQTKAYGGGVSSFNRTWTSSTEYAAMKLLEM